MDIAYKNKKIKRVCTDVKTAERAYGQEMAEKIHQRIDEIAAADTVEEMMRYHIGRCHPLSTTEKGNMPWIWFNRIDWCLKKSDWKFKSSTSWKLLIIIDRQGQYKEARLW